MSFIPAARSFYGHPSPVRQQTTRADILQVLRYRPEGLTAWEVARWTDRLGSTVSSRMFKMAKQGQIYDTGRKTVRNGRIYSLRPVVWVTVPADTWIQRLRNWWSR